jgi:hypothetical protein
LLSASPEDAWTPPRIKLNEPPPVIGPATMSKIVTYVALPQS